MRASNGATCVPPSEGEGVFAGRFNGCMRYKRSAALRRRDAPRPRVTRTFKGDQLGSHAAEAPTICSDGFEV